MPLTLRLSLRSSVLPVSLGILASGSERRFDVAHRNLNG